MSAGTILVLDDEAMLAFDIADGLKRAGYLVAGPYHSSQPALAAIEAFPPDVALLDINLGRGETSERVADELARRNIPFTFLTGYTTATMTTADRFRLVPSLSKPAARSEVLLAVESMMQQVRGQG